MKIVIACDGSEQSEQSIILAGTLPLKNATFKLIHVAPRISYDVQAVSESASKKIDEFNDNIQREGQKLLKKSSAILKELGHEPTTEMMTGEASSVLLETSQQADLVVMGSRGINPIESFLLGSVSDALVRHGHCSILLYKPNTNKVDHSSQASIKLAVGFDDTSSSRAACHYLKNFDLQKIAAIDLLSVMQLSYSYGISHTLSALEIWPKHKATIEESLLTVQKEISNNSEQPAVNSRIISDACDVADALNTHAVEEESDLIIVGSKGKNALDRVFLGSVSNRLAHNAQRSLLVVR